MKLADLPNCDDCGRMYGEYKHPPGMHYDPTAHACCGFNGIDDCQCGSDNAWGFCNGCLEELFGQEATHDNCSRFDPVRAELFQREWSEWCWNNLD